MVDRAKAGAAAFARMKQVARRRQESCDELRRRSRRSSSALVRCQSTPVPAGHFQPRPSVSAGGASRDPDRGPKRLPARAAAERPPDAPSRAQLEKSNVTAAGIREAPVITDWQLAIDDAPAETRLIQLTAFRRLRPAAGGACGSHRRRWPSRWAAALSRQGPLAGAAAKPLEPGEPARSAA